MVLFPCYFYIYKTKKQQTFFCGKNLVGLKKIHRKYIIILKLLNIFRVLICHKKIYNFITNNYLHMFDNLNILHVKTHFNLQTF